MLADAARASRRGSRRSGAVGFNATWQSVVQRESLSRVTSYDLFGSFALGPVGFALGGLLAEPLGPSTALLLAGLAMAALSAFLCSFASVRAL